MKKYILFIITGMSIFSLNSCLSPSKLYYFHDQVVHSRDTIENQRKSTVQKIQKGDRLSILVTSNNPEILAYLNPFGAAAGSEGNTNGYLVNMEGEIEFPLLGNVKVNGLTSEEVANLLKRKLEVYYKNPYVFVNLSGRVFVVNNRTGGHTVPIVNERLTIYELIAQSGGAFDNWDKKSKVWIIREENGIRTYDKINLNSKYMFKSPYYYLHNNDLIYIQPSWMSSASGANNPLKIFATVSSTVVGLIVLFFTTRK